MNRSVLLRDKIGQDKGLLEGKWKPVWVIDFPMFDWDEKSSRWNAIHHPFTAPSCSADELKANTGGALSRAYDLVLNGTEVGGGSIRIHKTDMQQVVFDLLGMDAEESQEKFGFLLDALKYGCPPHGGMAFGLDRLVMIMAGASTIRDVMAFPKTQTAACPLTSAPALVSGWAIKRVSHSLHKASTIRSRIGKYMSTSARAIQGYSLLSDEECDQRILKAKEKLGDRCVILGHHYQRNEVFKHADYSGDSLKLSRHAADSKAEYIVFCGVHFMAEVSVILSRPDQVTILPDMAAGCSMADMANLKNVERSWKELNSVLNADEEVTPVTYINSAADLKSFCGRHEGIVCTSSNAQHVLNWCFEKR